MKLIILISALIFSSIPVKAQEVKFTPKEESIFYAGTILGTGVMYCNFMKEGKASDKDRKEHMESMLDIYKNKTEATKDYGEIIDRVYASAMVCD
jgi:hypothetical protein